MANNQKAFLKPLDHSLFP